MSKQAQLNRRRFLGVAAMALAAQRLSSPFSVGARSKLSALTGASAWLNSEPLTAANLDKKVVLVDFWTYSCINWRRQLPYVRAWYEKYKDQGLVVIGVHSPEFSFEKNVDNIRWAAMDMRIAYPIAVDSDHTIWRAFDNEYWPALYFIDAKGEIRHHAYGEGQYAQSETVLQRLLGEAGAKGLSNATAAVNPTGAEAAADWSDLKSGENYVSYERTENFSSPGGAKPNKISEYAFPKRLDLNSWALSGEWTIGKEAIVLNKPDGRIAYRFHARDLHLVMGPELASQPVPFRILIDGQPPRATHGVDVDEEGKGMVKETRMYQLVRQSTPISDRQFEIQFLAPGAEAFSFTFG